MEMVILMVFFPILNFSYQESCVEEATGFYGSDVIINCSLDPNANGIYWHYDNEVEPLIQCRDDEKSGIGYDRGEYDIDRNGSLLIKDVHFTHEGNYQVVIIWGTTDDVKHEQFNIKFSVIEHCPPYQTGYLGEDVVIVCHFKPNFTEVRWFNDTSVDEPLIKCEGSEMCCPSIEKFIITSNGSLMIRAISEENRGNYTVVLTDANNITSRYEVIFVAEASCGVMSPDNGYLSHVRKTITLTKVICNEGYHISVSNYSVCLDDQEIESDGLFGSSPMCIPDDFTSTRPTLPSDTTKMSLITPTNDDIEWKNWKIVIIIESALLSISLVVNAVAVVCCVKLHFSQNKTPRDEHQSTEEELNLNTEQGETSM